ncbi:hypothetical protein AB0M43_38560 [Longispora sp. NPDC051575]|uniref:hypothetical protein n=1 Tax=Longispora sp. NPDC051575 TaxID=3154943 RepID=UPI003413BAE7
MPEEPSLPEHRDVLDYLTLRGWAARGEGPAGTLWAKDNWRVGIPREPDGVAILGVVDRLARAEGRDARDVSVSIRHLRFDVAYLRAANDFRITDKIPLDTASKIIVGARMMLRATATTARSERAQIGNSYSRRGDAVIRDAFMGHTQRGSFVIPVLVPISEPPAPDLHQPTLDFTDHQGPESHRSPTEPFERRVVRTFAQSMQAVNELVVEPARAPDTDTMHELVYRGVSREFVSALAGVLAEPAIAEFQTEVHWAPVVAAPATMPHSVTIDADATDLVKLVADRLRQQRITPRQVFSGTIVQLRHERRDDPYGEIGIATVRRGRASEIRVRLPMALYTQAWVWHNAGRAVLVEGEISRSPGRPSIVENPTRCHPLDELLLD